MRTILIIGAIVLAFLAGQVLGAPTAKYLIDSTPGEFEFRKIGIRELFGCLKTGRLPLLPMLLHVI